jgi:hypothetical protein
MNTTTAADVRNAFNRYESALRAYGLIPAGHHLVLSEGSKTYGNAYRVNLTGDRAADGSYPNGSGHSRPPIGSDYLGMTRAEAAQTLNTMAQCVWDMARLLQLSDA